MNRHEFGILITSLREDLRLTQLELAERSGLDVFILSSIERGLRKGLLKDNVLLKLAQGLRLTSLERRELMFAATGIDEHQIFRTDQLPGVSYDPQEILHSMANEMARIALPAFITDGYCDILAANLCCLAFYPIPADTLLNENFHPSAYNQASFVFDRNLNLLSKYGADWENQAMIHLRYFRRRTLRVRQTSYYSLLVNDLMDPTRHPFFEKLWNKMLHEATDDFMHNINQPESLKDFSFTEVENLMAVTVHGELYLHQALPTNQQTAERIFAIYQSTGAGFRFFAPFPDERKARS